MKDEKTENIVIALHSKGWSIRRISRELNISRERIHRWVVSNSVLRDTTAQAGIRQKKQQISKLDPHKSYIGDLLERYSDITGQRMYEHLKEKGYDGGITIVRDYLKSIRVVASKTPVRMVETLPGQRAAHDWSDYRIQFTTNKPSELTPVTFFSYILGYSRRQYISVVDNKKQSTLFRELIAAFIYLDGVPREVKSDNQKACVDGREMGKPIFNRKFLEFATWYRFTPLAITPGKPTENLKIERPFYYLERSFLNAREFKDMEDLKKQLSQWLSEVNDLRRHGTTKKRPIDLYIEEHPYLQRLPINHFDTSLITQKVVNQESCILWEGYQYVVDQKYMFEQLSVRITETQIVIYSPMGEQIACYELADKERKERYVGDHKKNRKKPGLVMADVILRLEGFGPEMHEYIEQIKQHKPESWRYHLRSLLTLRVNYRTEDIIFAVRRAMKYKVFESGTIEGFLANNSDPRYSIKLSFNPRNKNNNDEQ